MSSNNSECYYKPSLKDKIKTKWREIKYQYSPDRLRYWFIKHLFSKLLKSNELYMSDVHLFREMEIAGWNEDKVTDVKFLANVCHILDKFGHINDRDIHNIAEKWKLLSPLTFSAEEFGGSLTNRPLEYRQNHRDSSVFIYGENDFRDVDAILWKTKAKYDISDKSHTLRAVDSLCTHHCTCWLYDEKNDSWMLTHNTQKINLLRKYYGDKSFTVPCIEIYDSEDKQNDYYCYIANKDSIPSEFYKWFILTEVTKYDEDSEDMKELAFLKENDMKQLLFKPVAPQEHKIENIIINDAKILIEVAWITDKNAIIEALISAGISENSIQVCYSDENISLIIPTTEENKSIINRIAKQFNYKEKENGKE